jgi:hypothetical protein
MRDNTRLTPGRLILAVLLAGGLTALGGCGIQPWVKPYERANLADPIMSWGRHPASDAYMHHVYDVREAARGGTGATGGGCGCN